MVDETNIIFGLNDSTGWLPNNNNKVDIGSTTNKIKDIYCRRILCNDIDVTSNLGRSSIGYCGKHDYATFSHYDSNNINSFAVGQTNFGETTINSSKNKNLNLSINNNPELIILDESLNALDLNTEVKIIESIKNLSKTLPVIRDFDSSVYFKEDAGKLLIGIFDVNSLLF